jgi:multidrug efflux pump subunit AcrA (membrane-fusion protein)
LPRRPLEWALAIVAVALVVIAITSLGTGSSSSSAATKRTATVGKGVVQSTVSGNGTLEPAQKVELGFGASGEVTAIRVKAGQKVTKGEVLAEVDSSSARASLAAAEAQLIEAEEAVEAAAEAEEEESEEVAYEGGARTVFVGLMSTEGTAAAKDDEAEKQAMAEKEAAEKEAAEKAAAEKEAAEGEEKKPSGKEEAAAKNGSKGSDEGQEPGASEGASGADKEAAGGANQDAAAESESSAPTESAGAGSETGGAETGGGATVSLPTAEANLLSAELSVKSARQEVRETTLRAPISGTIASISGAVGETVSGGSSGGGDSEGSVGAGGEESGGGGGETFMVLAQLHRLKMEVSFSEADIGKVREGQTATVAIDSMEGTELAGKVTKVSVLPSEGSSSVVEYPATILLTQSAKGLRAGMSASAEVVVEQVKNALTVPSEAISQAGGGKTVTVEEDGKEVAKAVTTGLVGDETTEVMSGVKAGQTLVLPEVAVATGSEGSGGGSLEEMRSAGGGAFAVPGGATGGPPGGATMFFGGGQ